ncbi:MAG: hypothetical protein QXJ11_01135 [Candidatus Bathyarchaeia archaeon]
MDNIENAIREYLKKCSEWQSRKEIFNAVYPKFKEFYSEDTFNRLLTRSINKLINKGLILRHKFQPYYYSPEADVLQLARHLKTFVQEFDIADLPLSRLLNFSPSEIPINKSSLDKKKGKLEGK